MIGLGITKGGKHSYKDFGLWIKSKYIEIPQKKKILVTVPFMNGSYDFSRIYGDQPYEERELTYEFEIVERSKELLNIRKIQCLEWLHDGGKTELYDDTIPGYYFLAECVETKVTEEGLVLVVSATFTAYPFKICAYVEGHDIWDIFNFELDYAIQTKFSINEYAEVYLYNASAIEIAPTVVCTSVMEIEKDGQVFLFNIGSSKDVRFKLHKKNNDMIIKGTGTIEFLFFKEVL